MQILISKIELEVTTAIMKRYEIKDETSRKCGSITFTRKTDGIRSLSIILIDNEENTLMDNGQKNIVFDKTITSTAQMLDFIFECQQTSHPLIKAIGHISLFKLIMEDFEHVMRNESQ